MTSAAETPQLWEDPRNDKRTYWGRVRSFQQRMNPLYMFVAQADIDKAKEILQQPFEPGSQEKVRWADGVVKATVHPQTGEAIGCLGRMATFVPINIPICAGMLFTAPTIPNLVTWQWINQTYNALFNYAQANKPVGSKQAEANQPSGLGQYKGVLTGYTCATVVSVGLAVGSSFWLKNSRMSEVLRRRLQMIVPYTAVAAAGVANVVLMRSKELSEGIPVYQSGSAEPLGYSKAAARQAILQTAISRVVLPIPILALPPPILAVCYRIPLIQSSNALKKLAELTVLVAGLWVGLPCAVAIFPQEATMRMGDLEPELRTGDPESLVNFNKGV